MSLVIPLLGVDEVRELSRVPQEEHRGVVVYPIPVTLCSPQLDRKTTRVTSGIGRTTLSTDSAEANGQRSLVANLAEEIGAAQVSDVVRHLKVSVSASTLGVDDSLGDTLTVEVSKKIDKMEIWIVN